MNYCLIGEKLSHSYSSEIHTKNGLNYTLKEISKDQLQSFVEGKEYTGYNVTAPYKKDVVKFMDYLDEYAKETGSVNTVYNYNGLLYGFNTDYLGLEFVFKHYGVSVKGKHVTVLGSGGMGKTAEYYCKKYKAKSVNIVSRKGEINYENYFDLLKKTQILINATPVGTAPNYNDSPVNLKHFKHLQFVFDCVYNPAETTLLAQANQLRIKNCNGMLMLCAQALYAEEIWGYKTPNKNQIFSTYLSLLQSKVNIVLYGMTAVGKTTLGEKLAKELNRKFYDSDREFQFMYKTTPEEYIERNGENAFREKEDRIVKTLSCYKGAVISVGGGAVLNKENVDALNRNGILIQVKRDMKKLIIANRPNLDRKKLEKLYHERRSKYEKISPLFVDNNKKPESGVKNLIKIYENTCC